MDFSELMDDDEPALLKPRDIFMALEKEERFTFPRDIQTEVMDAWFAAKDRTDTIIKLNVGSGKTLVGLMLLQSSINDGCGPALYVCPDKQLVSQVIEEARLLGLDVAGMRLIDGARLESLKAGFETFVKGLGDPDVLNDVSRIEALLTANHLTPASFISQYTTTVKS